MDELKYLETYSSKNTVRSYKYTLKTFLTDVLGKGELEGLAERYFKEDRDFKKDLQNFLAHIKERPPKTVRLMLSAIHTFLIENDVELSQKFWRSLNRRVKGNRAVTIDKIPSNVQLRRIIMHMPVHGKALYLSLASSGMRIGEALKLDRNDIDLTSDPVKINIRRENTKTGNSRVAFLSGEAKEHIEEWLKYRNEYLKSASKRSRFGKSTEDKRLFPFDHSTAYFILKTALDKTKLNHKDDSTNRYKIHPHVLRKFFRTKMGSVIPVDVTEALMGHEGYLTEIYRRYDVEDLAKFYKQGETAVMIFGRKEEIAALREEVEEKSQQLQTLVNGLSSENMELKRIAREQTEEIGNLSKSLAETRAEFVKLVDFQIWKDQMEQQIREEQEAFKVKLEWQQEASRRRKFTINGEEKWLDLFEWQEASGISFEEAEERWFKNKVKRKEQQKKRAEQTEVEKEKGALAELNDPNSDEYDPDLYEEIRAREHKKTEE